MDNGFDQYRKLVFEGGCPVNAQEEVTVTVPVKIRADADVDEVEIKCKGHAVITSDSDDPKGEPHAVKRFTISQKISIKIPVKFFAECIIGESSVDFDPSSDQQCGC